MRTVEIFFTALRAVSYTGPDLALKRRGMKVPRSASFWRMVLVLLAVLAGPSGQGQAWAEYGVEVPALAASGNSSNDLGAFTVKMLWWDQKAEPDPVTLTWGSGTVNSFEYGRIIHGTTDQTTTRNAFRYAIDRTPSVTHTGTVNVQGIAYGPAFLDGPSSGAAMAIGFIALFKGDSIRRGIALTGTLEPGGLIGEVGGLTGKVRATAREGYHMILIPMGQLSDPRWPLESLALELDVTIKEVRTIEEAYALMTGGTI